MITSGRNPHIKQLRALQTRKGRKKSGLFIAEGIHHVAAALESRSPIEAVYYSPELLSGSYGTQLVNRIREAEVPVRAVAEQIFGSLSGKDHPQGILAVVRQTWHTLEETSPTVVPWALATVMPQDPGNIGALLRTLDAVGAGGLILLDGGADPFHPTAVRASMGAVFRLRVMAASTGSFLDWARRHGYTLIGSSAHSATDYREMQCPLPAILLLGSEREGLSTQTQSQCAQVLRLPMRGGVTSLNLAVAGGVLLYHMWDCLEGQAG